MNRFHRFPILIAMLLGLLTSTVQAQEITALWATGSAVPGRIQQLQRMPDGTFRFAGALQAGELRVQTTRKANAQTRYLAPTLIDALLVNKGSACRATTDGQAPGWQVLSADPHYRLVVDPQRMTLRGEIFQPWGELFIAGGATEAGWNEGKMLLMQQDINDPYVWTWEGELRNRPENVEPRRFKFQGQDRWGPKSLHPFAQDTDILKDSRLRTGGADNKWSVSAEGRYRITVDIFHETVRAERLDR